MSDRAPLQGTAAAAHQGRAIIARHDPRQLALLPEVEFAPQPPKPGTLADRLLTMLAAGEHLTHPGFETRTGSWRLAAVAFELGLLGWHVLAERVPAPTIDRPDRSIARYALAAEHAVLAGRRP